MSPRAQYSFSYKRLADALRRVTTRTGDAGRTSLADGRRYARHDAMIDLVGALDSANSAIGMVAAETATAHAEVLEAARG